MNSQSDSTLRNFLTISYDELEDRNLASKKLRQTATATEMKKHTLAVLKKETRLKAITIGFSDLEGRFHVLDYDKNFFLNSYDNLTFDGSSIRGFSRQAESDLRLSPDWGAIWWLPSDVFGPGKVLIMGDILDRDGRPYEMDSRGLLKAYAEKLKTKFDYTVYAANEIEGFLLKGEDVEKSFSEKSGFEIASRGGYYHSLPSDLLRIFIDRNAEAQRALGFENEKDHPEVAPSQFELNYSYSDVVNAADQIQLYKLVSRQIAASMGMTACFLPKPIMGVNGSGMHTNMSIAKGKKNLFFDPSGKAKLSKLGWDMVNRILSSASDMCLILNSSVNAYRRLDPHFEAPNEIKVSEVDRGSMIRIPLFNEKSARIEVRSVGPDANPYLTLYSIVKVGLEGTIQKEDKNKRPRVRFLPSTIQTALNQFRQSDAMGKMLGINLQKTFAELKQDAAERCPAQLGNRVKNGEVLYHHEVYNQMLWNDF